MHFIDLIGVYKYLEIFSAKTPRPPILCGKKNQISPLSRKGRGGFAELTFINVRDYKNEKGTAFFDFGNCFKIIVY